MVAQAVAPLPDLADVQGLVYAAYKKLTYAGYVLARLGDDAARSRRWLAALAPDITPAVRPFPSGGRTHVALSPDGLVALGYPGIVGLPDEANDGMWQRRIQLHDDPSETWEFGAQDSPIHAIVIVYADTAAARDAMVARRRADLAAAGAQLYDDQLSDPALRSAEREGGMAPPGHEAFGFADGLAQPFVPGHHGAARPGQEPVALGEILLGYQNAYERMPASPKLPGPDFDLGRNGTYLVFRKLEQDVPALWQWIDRSARDIGKPTDWLAAKLMGRWPSGASIEQTPDHDDASFATPARTEDFNYLEPDADGLRCPIASHIRRANPRDARAGSAQDSLDVVARHRIVRRGRPFGPPIGDRFVDDGKLRGLYFVSLQASIARGFEFIQQTWLGNHSFHGLYQEVDPIMGNEKTTCVTIPAEPFRYRLRGVPDVVRVSGGGYFLLPSLSAIRRLAAG